MQAGQLNTRIVLERGTETQSASGMNSVAWSVLSRVWASKRVVGGSEKQQAAQTQAAQSYKIQIRRYEGLKAGDRVLLPVAWTLLNGAITANTTSIVVDDAAGTSGSLPTIVQCESELMTMTGGHAGTTWTVARASDSTTGAIHADNTVVAVMEVLEIRDVTEVDMAWQILTCSARAD